MIIPYVLCTGCAILAWAAAEFELDDITGRRPAPCGCDRCDSVDAVVYDIRLRLPA